MNFKLPRVFKNKFVVEISIFAIYFSFTLYETNGLLARYKGEDRNTLLILLTTLWATWAYVYTRGIIDFFLLRKRYIWFGSFVVIGIMATSALQFYILLDTTISERTSINQTIVNIFIFTLLTTLVYLGAQYLIKSREFYELEGVKKEVELTQLKNQLNPHFLFNALNNIYSYSLENNKHGNDLVMKLSQLMRFILETNKADLIPLHHEITFIDNYIAFEKERLGYRCEIQFSKDVDNKDILLPPLLLFPLIENAFKHGTNTLEHSIIRIQLSGSKEKVLLSVTNPKLTPVSLSTKTGLANVKRRLELLYPSKHSLEIMESSNQFEVKLVIQLYENQNHLN